MKDPSERTPVPINHEPTFVHSMTFWTAWLEAYNCHCYVWHDGKGDPTDPANPSDTTPPNWDDDPADDVTGGGYDPVPPDDPVQEGDAVLYRNHADDGGGANSSFNGGSNAGNSFSPGPFGSSSDDDDSLFGNFLD